MKEKYFTHENIADKAKTLKLEAAGRHKLKFTAKNPALMVLDMQKFFQETSSHAQIPSFDVIVPGIQGLIYGFKNKGLPVIFTKHLNTPENAFMMDEWWRDIITTDSIYSGIVEDFDTSGHVVIEKSQYDAFYKTGLDGMLRELKINNLVITGVMTHLCCETTTRSAFVRGFRTFFTVDGTATYNEQFHRNTLINLAHGFSVPVLTDEILEKIND